jgi:hypothetical protein
MDVIVGCPNGEVLECGRIYTILVAEKISKDNFSGI